MVKACGFCPAEANDVAANPVLIQQIELLKQRALPSLAVALKKEDPTFSARIPAMVRAALADSVTLRTSPRPAVPKPFETAGGTAIGTTVSVVEMSYSAGKILDAFAQLGVVRRGRRRFSPLTSNYRRR